MSKTIHLFNLAGRTAVVTGGCGLLGKEFSRTLAEAGASVVIADIDGAQAQALAGTLSNTGFQALGIETDVILPDSVGRMVRNTLETYGRLDILVNSAALDPKFDPSHGKAYNQSFEDYPLDSWKQAVDVNLTGMFLASQAAVRPMLDQGGGVIVNLCSIYGLVGPDQRIYTRENGEGEPEVMYKPVYYSVTKAGVLGMTSYLAAYYAGKNIRVNALTPGGVFNKHDQDFLQAYSTRTILGRMANKDEMNAALLFLASDASSYMTGSNLVVDGGWTAW
jgi:NAD(P)-dependent dehydrogenase (short-subunit alcohol dehydrogenase family)